VHKLCGTGFSFPVGRGLSLVEARLADARDLAVVSLAVQLAIVLLEGLQVQNNITFVAYVQRLGCWITQGKMEGQHLHFTQSL